MHRLSLIVLSIAFAAIVLGNAGWTSLADDSPQLDEPAATESEATADEEPMSAEVPRLDPVPPPTPEAIEESIRRGADFLIGYQNENGSWGSPTHTKGLNIYAPVPGAHHGFRAATTALCVSALLEYGTERSEVREAVDRAEEWIFENLEEVRRATPDAIYNVWAHGYGIQALVRLHAYRAGDPERQARIAELIAVQFDRLTRYESVDGGWGYYDFRTESQRPGSDSISFVNAAILVAFKEAQNAGFEPPADVLERALAATQRQRLPDGCFLYGEYLDHRPRHGINRPGGSLGRTQACHLCLRMWGDETVTDQLLSDWLDRLFARNGWLDIGRKRPIPHESWFSVAGYFYYFGHYYGAYCIQELPVEQRPEFQSHMSHLMLDRQETDGSWWDYPLYDYHKPYGTAFALMTLMRCRAE